jgi:hypothetical protein
MARPFRLRHHIGLQKISVAVRSLHLPFLIVHKNASTLSDQTRGLVNTFHPPRAVVFVSCGTIDEDHVPFGLPDLGRKVQCQPWRTVDQPHRLGACSAVLYEVRLKERILAADPAEPFLLILDEHGPSAVVQIEPERGIIAHAKDEEIHRWPDGASNEEHFIGMHLDSEPLPLTLDPL